MRTSTAEHPDRFRRALPGWSCVCGLLLLPVPVGAQLLDATAVTAELRARQATVIAGNSVWVDFTLHNPTDQVAVLYLPGSRSLNLNPMEMGLPLEHVFGRVAGDNLSIHDSGGRSLRVATGPEAAPDSVAVRLAPQATVGSRLDLAVYCPELLHSGRYELQWRPYGGTVLSNTITIEVAALKEARIETDFGPMTIRFFYEDAPRHVRNFLELAEDGLYDNLTFHRVEPGYLIQGGAPNGEPTAIRPDGKLLPPEFNDRPFRKGTVGMARKPNDPESGSCQFFITYTRWKELDGQYTAFGELKDAQSLETLDEIMDVPLNDDGTPRNRVYIRTVRLQEAVSDSRTRPADRSFSER